MISSKKTIAIPPGDTIEEQMEDRGISMEAFASGMEMTAEDAERLIRGDAVLTPEIADRLEKVTTVLADYWLRLERNYRGRILQVQRELEEEQQALEEKKQALEEEGRDLAERFRALWALVPPSARPQASA